jgi:hypothetical protein
MTKKFLIPGFLLVLLFSAGFISIQPVKKIYGFKQASIPGIIPSFEGQERLKQAERKQNYNYWFYIEFPKTEIIKPDGLWVGGLPYDLKVEEIKELPVIKIIYTGSEKNDTTVMVPVSRNKVMLVYPSALAKDSTIKSKYVASLTANNELVISYRNKNKRYYITLKKLKELGPDVRP